MLSAGRQRRNLSHVTDGATCQARSLGKSHAIALSRILSVTLLLWVSTPAEAGLQSWGSPTNQEHRMRSHDKFEPESYRRQPLDLAHPRSRQRKLRTVKGQSHGSFPNPYGAWPNPFTVKPNPYGAWPNPFTVKPNPYGAWPNPFTVKPNPYGAWPNPFTVKPNPYGAWPNPFTARPNPREPVGRETTALPAHSSVSTS
jgi:hypothetical protein